MTIKIEAFIKLGDLEVREVIEIPADDSTTSKGIETLCRYRYNEWIKRKIESGYILLPIKET